MINDLSSPMSDLQSTADSLGLGEVTIGQPEMDLTAWRRDELKSINRDVMSFDRYEPDQPPEVRRAALVQGYLDSQHDLSSDNSSVTEGMRDQVATHEFGAEAAGSDELFVNALKARAQKQNDAREFQKMLGAGAQRSFFGEMALGETPPLESPFSNFIEANVSAVGYDSKRMANYRQGWEAITRDLSHSTEGMRDELEMTLAAFSQGGARQTAYLAYSSLPKEKRRDFLAHLSLAAQEFPAEKKKEFLANFKNQTARDIIGWAGSIKDGAKILNAPQTSFQKEYESNIDRKIAARKAAGGSVFSSLLDPFEVMAETFGGAKDSLVLNDAQRKLERNFRADVDTIMNEDFDPIDYLTKEGSWSRDAESAAYGLPGGIATTLTAMVPFVGTAAVFAGSVDQAYTGQRSELIQAYRKQGMGWDQADEKASAVATELAPIIAIPNTVIEHVQALIPLGKMPFLNAVGDQIQSAGGRFAMKTLASGVAETVTEMTQDFTPVAIRNIAAAVDADVPGSSVAKYFENFEHKSFQTFLMMLPLGLAAGMHGVTAEARARAFASASDLERRAIGVSAEDSAKLEEASLKGPSSFMSVFKRLELDPGTLKAASARDELDAYSTQKEAARESLLESGALPRVYVRGDSFEVYDTSKGKSLGLVDTAQDAVDLVNGHLDEADRIEGDKVPYLLSMMEAASISSRSGTTATDTTEVDLRLDQPILTKQAALESLADATRISEQVVAREVMAGGDGKIGKFILGKSSTTFDGAQRRTVNRIQAGGDVLTIFHEESHELWRAALAGGKLTRDEAVSFLRATDTVLRGRKTRRGGSAVGLLKDGVLDADLTDTAIDEAIAELRESEILRTRKNGKLPPGLLSQNLSAIARLAPGATKKFAAFFKALRGFWEVALTRSMVINRALKSGELDQAKYNDFWAKLTGENQTVSYNRGVVENLQKMVGENRLSDEFRRGVKQAQQGASVELPGLSQGLLEKLGKEQKPLVLKPKIVAKNKANHPEMSEEQSLRVLSDGLYGSAIAIQTKPSDKPNYWLLSAPSDGRTHNAVVELSSTKDGFEIVGWYPMRQRSLEQKRKKAEQEGGQVLIFAQGDSAGLSDSPLNRIGDTSFSEEEQDPFSISHSGQVNHLAAEALARVSNSRQQASFLTNVASRLADLKRESDQIITAFGKPGVTRAIVDFKALGEIKKEAREVRDKFLEEAEGKIYADYGSVLTDAELVKLRSQPLHSLFASPDSPLRGRLVSRSQWQKANPGEAIPAEFDGSGLVNKSLFGGYQMPDQAAQEAYVANLIKQPTPDAFYQALAKEANSVAARSADLKKAMVGLKAAKISAKSAEAEHIKTRTAEIKRDHNPMARAVRALQMLDAIALALPTDLRGKLGGHTALAKIGSEEGRLAYLRDRVGKVDAIVEKHLKKEFGRMFKKLFDKTKLKKDEAGKRREGKIGADNHAMFFAIKDSMSFSGEQAITQAQALLAEIESSELSPEQQAYKTQLALILPLVADWSNATSDRMIQAYNMAEQIFYKGLAGHTMKITERKALREAARRALKIATGQSGSARDRSEIERRALGFSSASNKDLPLLKRFITTNKSRFEKFSIGLLSYEQLLQTCFGNEGKQAIELANFERRASNQKALEVGRVQDDFSDFVTALAGDSYKGEQLLYKLQQPSLDWAGGDSKKLSELQAITATLMWRQSDGRRHMLGRLDDMGNPIGSWHHNQDFVDFIDKNLSAEARAIRDFIADNYGSEWQELNPIHRELYGVNMPSHDNYSPISVEPIKRPGGEMMDANTGNMRAGSALVPGSIRSRSASAIAEPDYKDALVMFIGHKKEMAHWKAYALLASETNAIMNNREFMNFVEAKSGKEAVRALRDWNELFAQGGARDAAAHIALMQGVSSASNRLARSILVGRASVIVIQSTQLGAALAEMPTGAYLKRLGKLLTGNLGWKAAIDSEFIQIRKKNASPHVQQALDSLKSAKPSMVGGLVRKLANGIGASDALFTAGTYAMIYDYQLGLAAKEGLAGPEAAQRAHNAASRLTERVAQPTRMATRSLLENKIQNPLARIWLNFISESRQKVMMTAYAASNRPAGDKARALFVTAVVSGIGATLVRALMRDLRNSDDDEVFDQKNWSPKKLALAALTDPLQGVPLLGPVVQNAIYDSMGVWHPDGTTFDVLKKAPRAAKNLLSGDESDVEHTIKDVEAILQAGAVFSETSANYTSMAHVARDVWSIGKNAAKALEK